MGIEVLPESAVLKVYSDVEHVLYLLAIVIITPLMVCIQLFVVLPLSYLASSNTAFYNRIKGFNCAIFKMTKYIFRPVKVDQNTSKEVPRFVIFGYTAPVCYTYQILMYAMMTTTYCLWSFWNVALLSSKVEVKCDLETELKHNTTECFNISLRLIEAVSSQISLAASIILVHIFLLEIFLKFTGGKKNLDKIWSGKPHISKITDLIRVVIAFGAQFFCVIILKIVFLIYFTATGFGRDHHFNLFDRSGWFAVSLFIDDLVFALLTPWFLLVENANNSTTTTTNTIALTDTTNTVTST